MSPPDEAATPDIDKLWGMTALQARYLRSLGITTETQVWEYLGNNGVASLDGLAASIHLSADRLIDVLAGAVTRPRWLLLGRIPLPRWDPFSVSALLAGAAFAAVTLRALLPLPAPLGLPGAAVAMRDLEAGRVLSADDLRPARRAINMTQFPAGRLGTLPGLILARQVAEGQAINYADVLRLQLVAAKDLPSGAVLSPTTVVLSWTPYDPAAMTTPGQALRRQARRDFRKGDLVLPQYLSHN